MAQHEVSVFSELVRDLSALNCWLVSTMDVERLSTVLCGRTAVSLLRRGKIRAIVAGRKFGSAADRLPQEFVRLTEQTAKIKSLEGRADASLLAAAFFHLRFENIHPLTDGNGRVGRLLLAEQCRRAYSASLAEILSSIHDCEHDYRAVFAAPRDSLQYELMANLLARVLAVPLSPAIQLPFALTPVFPERDTRPAADMRHARPTPQRRSAFF